LVGHAITIAIVEATGEAMSHHTATVTWQRGAAAFTDNRYSRVHEWAFDGGTRVRAAASPDVVPLPLTAADAVDPEEAFVAALASCHMLWFLSIAAQRGVRVDGYEDAAVGTMAKNATGRLAITEVVLRPRLTFDGTAPSTGEIASLHDAAHERCFLAASVNCAIRVEPR
jgi:organic hydroperoxide reductase OsmC/OhrA